MNQSVGHFSSDADRDRYATLHLWRRLAGWSALFILFPSPLLTTLFLPEHDFLKERISVLFMIFLGIWFSIDGYQILLAKWVNAERVRTWGARGFAGDLTGKEALIFGRASLIFGIFVFSFGVLGLVLGLLFPLFL